MGGSSAVVGYEPGRHLKTEQKCTAPTGPEAVVYIADICSEGEI